MEGGFFYLFTILFFLVFLPLPNTHYGWFESLWRETKELQLTTPTCHSGKRAILFYNITDGEKSPKCPLWNWTIDSSGRYGHTFSHLLKVTTVLFRSVNNVPVQNLNLTVKSFYYWPYVPVGKPKAVINGGRQKRRRLCAKGPMPIGSSSTVIV